MSIWSTRVEITAWKVAYDPLEKEPEIWVSLGNNDCVRLEVIEEALGREARAMLDRAMAAKLAAKLQEFADTGDLTPNRD